MTSPRAQPAVLEAAVETETDFGGRDRVWSQAASLWVSLTLSAPAEQTSTEASPAEAGVASAVARNHPDTVEGQRLLIADDPDPWRVRRVERGVPTPSRMTLRLDRLL